MVKVGIIIALAKVKNVINSNKIAVILINIVCLNVSKVKYELIATSPNCAGCANGKVNLLLFNSPFVILAKLLGFGSKKLANKLINIEFSFPNLIKILIIVEKIIRSEIVVTNFLKLYLKRKSVEVKIKYKKYPLKYKKAYWRKRLKSFNSFKLKYDIIMLKIKKIKNKNENLSKFLFLKMCENINGVK